MKIIIVTFFLTTLALTNADFTMLFGGARSNSGRVEVYHYQDYYYQWGTVCENGWGDNDARATCRGLGYNYGYAVNGAAFGQGFGMIWFDSVDCGPQHNDLLSCPHSAWGTTSCQHSQDAGVDCFDDMPVRLSWTGYETDSSSGRLEVYFNGAWKGVCGMVSSRNAEVVCRQLGMTGGTMRECNTYVGEYWMDSLECDGTEENIAMCSHRTGLGLNPCYNSRGMCVQCGDDVQQPITVQNVRLAGGSSSNVGRVEVFYYDRWGTVCSSGFGNNDASVICRQLGMHGGTAIHCCDEFPPGEGPIVLTEVDCTGMEGFLSECPHSMITGSCDHTRDMGVRCEDTQQPITVQDVRIVGGPSTYVGRVEVRYEGLWGTVCSSGFGNNDASVICRQLGMTGGTAIHCCNQFSPGEGPIALTEVDCTGAEASIFDCDHRTNTLSCDHTRDMGVMCDAPWEP